MPQVTVPSGSAHRFDLPEVCVVTGRTQDLVWRPVDGGRPTIELAYHPLGLRRLRRLRVIRWALGAALLAAGAGALAIPGLWAALVMILAVAVPALVWCHDREPRLVSAAGPGLVLHVPSRDAGQRIQARFFPWLPGASRVRPEEVPSVPAGALCGGHEGHPAVNVCRHCGDFICARCSWPGPPSGLIFCPPCHRRRDEHMRRLGFHLPPPWYDPPGFSPASG